MKKVEKKKPGPKPTGKGELIGVRLQPDLLDALDKHVKNTNAGSRADAMRKMAGDVLKRYGLLKPKIP
jgi:metal-responsive CopG/Arc/MetJ family transcriptional regulator